MKETDTTQTGRAQSREASAFWMTPSGRGELREERLPEPREDEAVVRALCSGISRGTERLVRSGAVPEDVAPLMRAPFQVGDFGDAVKYGYLSVGVVEQGPPGWEGTRVFCLFPHQDRYVVPMSALTVVPDDVPTRRAVLAGTVETAVNALWDAAPCIGDRVAVIGGGMVGCCVAALLARFPLQSLQLIDVDEARREVADRIGADFRHPDEAEGECDIVIHASASSAGLATGLRLLGHEGELIEMSWFGTQDATIPLGHDFHVRRLSVRASQVGTVSPRRRSRRTPADRLRLSLDLLRDERFDALLTGETAFADLPSELENIVSGPSPQLCHVVAYPPPTT